MSIKINLYRNFIKKENSTLRPKTLPQEYTAVLKDNTGMINPRIILKVPVDENPTVYNYAYIPLYDRYYYVTDWVWNIGVWELSLNIDYLASWRDTIGESSLYVTRSSAEFDTEVTDRLYPAKTTPVFNSKWLDIPGWATLPTLGRGTYVIGVVNSSSSSWGTIVYYALSASQMSDFRSFMLAGTDDWASIGTDLNASLLKSFASPFEYVVSSKWFPFTISGGTSESIKFGFWDSGITATKIDSLMDRTEFELERPSIPDIERGKWVGRAPFTEYYIQCLPWGLIPIDSTDINEFGVVVVMLIDYVTGTGTLNIYRRTAGAGTPEEGRYSETYGLIGIAQASIGVDVKLSQLIYDVSIPGSLTELITGSLGAGAQISFMTGDSIGKGSGIGSGISAAISKGSAKGEQSGYAVNSMAGTIALIAKSFPPIQDDNSEQGKPLCATRKISTIPGYVRVEHGDIEMMGTSKEKSAVQEYLERGFFYE